MKRPLLFLILFVFVIEPVSIVHANWLDESITTTTSPSTSEFSHGVWAWGGRHTVRIPSTSVRPFNISMPKATAGCGGIDVFWGGFSMLDPDRIVQYAQNILAAAPAYAFNLALQNLCEPCHAVMGHLNTLANKMNNMSLDSCQAAQNIVDFGNSYLQKELYSGASEGSSSGWLDWMDGFVANVPSQTDDFFTSWLNDHEAMPLEKRLVWPEADDRYLSFWVSLVADKMSNNSFSNFLPGYEAAQNFFPTPKEFVNHIRALSGDVVFYRGQDGSEGGSFVIGSNMHDGATQSDEGSYKVIKDKQDALYSVDIVNGEIVYGSAANEYPRNPLLGAMRNNVVYGLALPAEPDAVNYTNTVNQGYQGFPFTTTQPGLPDIPTNDAPQNLLAPEPGCANAVDCARTRINTIFANITATTAAGVQTNMSNFVMFNSLPVYVLTNRVALLSAKYPAIIAEVSDRLAEIASFSYANARLNESISYAQALLQEGRAAAHRLKKRKYPDIEILLMWIDKAERKLTRARMENNKTMIDHVDKSLKHISEKINHYLDIDSAIVRAVTASSFNSVYGGDWN